MKVAITRFPGTNRKFDIQYTSERLGVKAQIIWHKEEEVDTDLAVLPGEFSYGDYLRCAAIAEIVSVIRDITAYAKRGGYILGVYSSSQILLESGLLEGAMRYNNNLNFISKNQDLRATLNDNVFSKNFQRDEIINLPVAHSGGSYYADEATSKKIQDKDLILLKCEPNPNGSVLDTAGVCDENKKISGPMSHPERVYDKVLGSDIGLRVLESFMRE